MIYKSIKIPEKTYRGAEYLKKELTKDESIAGVRKVSLSEAVSYAIAATLENLKKRRMFESAAGGWSDMDSESLIKEIYSSRLKHARREVSM